MFLLKLRVAILLLSNFGIVLSFDCPKLKGEKGTMADGVKCGNKFKKLLDNICKFGLTDQLIKNIAKGVGLRAVKCVDEGYEHFLIDEGYDCSMTDSQKGVNMMADKKNFCDKKKQDKVQSCALDAITRHKEDFKKLVPFIPHLVVLCNRLVDAIHKECKNMYPSFPNI